MENIKVGKYLSLAEFCSCTKTYKKYAAKIDPFPKNPESITAIKALNQFIIDPIIDNFGRDKFQLTYGFCSPTLKRYLNQKDPITGFKNGRIEPRIDQHMAHEINRKGKYYCQRLGAACDCLIVGLETDKFVDWIISEKLPFDSLYFYSNNQPIHISYSTLHKRDIWTFNSARMPSKKGVEQWIIND